MKSFIILILLIAVLKANSQSFSNCDILNLTLDNENQVIDVSNQPLACGISGVYKCRYLKIKFTKTVNGIVAPRQITGIRFEPPNDGNYQTNLNKHYIRIFNPFYIASANEYEHSISYKHEFFINDPAPTGDEFHCLICPGTEIGPMKIVFKTTFRNATIPIPTNVKYVNWNVFGIQPMITWKSIKDKYYMVFRTANPNAKTAWLPISPSLNWIKGDGKIIFLRDSSNPEVGRQYKYIVISSNSQKPSRTGTNGGSYSVPIFGCKGPVLYPY